MIEFPQMEAINFGPFEHIVVPLKDQGLTLIRGVNNDTTAADSNGSGKSSLLKAFTWGLFGQVVRDGKITNVVHTGADKAVVKITFTDGKDEYLVERTHSAKGGGSVKLFTNGKSTTERKSVDTNARIVELLGLDWEAFRNSVLYGQNDLKRFADPTTTDGERKTILKRILRLNVLDDGLKIIRNDLKDCRDRVTQINTERKVVTMQLSDAEGELTASSADSARWTRTTQQELDYQLEQAKQHKDSIKALSKRSQQLKRLEDIEKRLKETIEPTSELRDKVKALQVERDGLTSIIDAARDQAAKIERDELGALNRDIHSLDVSIASIQAEIKKLEGLKVCPVCRTPTDSSEHTATHIESLRNDVGSKAGDRGAKLIEVDKVKDRLKAGTDIIAKRKAERAAIETQLNDLDEELDELNELQDSLEDIQEKIKAASEVKTEEATLTAKLEAARASAEEIKARTNPHSARVTKAQDKVDKAKEALGKQDTALEAVEAEMKPLLFWERGFSNTGLPSMIMDNVVPMITESANGYLNILADGDLSVAVETERALKSSEAMRDEITISTQIEGNLDVWSSGGQERKISLAIDMALMDLVATREGAQIDLLLLDEVLDGLDAEGRARVMELLNYLKTVRSSVFVISHHDDIKDHFERVITVTKQGKRSTVELM